jgi:hypothetical protein
MAQSDYAASGITLSPDLAGRWPRVSAVDLAITLVFALLVVMQIAHHEMWRDEIHTWGMVLASPSLSDLFANLRYTGHPGLWYLLVWAASWFTESPYAVQVVHAGISVLLIAAIGLWSPFSRLEKVLLLCSYFVLFEYTVISRNYGIGMLLAFVYAQCRATQPERVYLNGLLLGLLANTNMFGLVLSGAFACELALDMLIRRGWSIQAVIGPLLRGAAVYLPLVALAVAAMLPAHDISWRSTGEPFQESFDLTRLSVIVGNNVASMLPIHALDYWIADRPSHASPQGTIAVSAPVVLLLAVPALIAVYIYVFKDHRRLLIIPGLTLAGSVAIGQLIYSGEIRHWGINFVAFAAVLWIERRWNPVSSLAATALLGISAVAGVAISVQQSQLTFSEAGPTARWIRDNRLANDALVMTPDTMAAPVAVYLGKPAYFLDCSCIDEFMFYHNRRDAFDESQIPARLARAVQELQGKPILFVTSDALTPGQTSRIGGYGIGTAMLAEFTNAGTDENYYVYRVMEPGEPAPDSNPLAKP